MGLFERTPRFVKRFGDLAARDQRRRRRLCRGRQEPRLPDRGADLPRQEVRAFRFAAAAWVRSARGARPPCAGGRQRRVFEGRPAARLPRIWRIDLAIKPNDGETFLREVDEELRKEQMNNFVTRYGWAIVGVVVLLLGAIGGCIWWQDRQQAAAAAAGRGPARGARQHGERQPQRRRAPRSAELAESDVEGYRAAALFARANQPDRGRQRTRPRSPPCKSIADDRGARRALSPGRPGPPDRARIRHAAAAGQVIQRLAAARRAGPAPGSAAPARWSASPI